MNSVQLTDIDRRIIDELVRDGRLSNKELAARVGLPRSTCHGRVRALEESGVIRGFRAEVDPEVTGANVEALISVSVLPHARSQVASLIPKMRQTRGVQHVYLVGGEYDIVLHVACANVPTLREFIRENFGANADLGPTHTQLIFEHASGTAPV